MNEEERMIVNAGRKAKELMETDSYKFHVKLLDEAIQSQLFGLVRPANGLDGAFQSEFEKGTINGLRLSRNLFQTTVEAAEGILKKWQQEGFKEEAQVEPEVGEVEHENAP
jgi:hypothetical protein